MVWVQADRFRFIPLTLMCRISASVSDLDIRSRPLVTVTATVMITAACHRHHPFTHPSQIDPAFRHS